MTVSFLPSQIGERSQTPLSYTADPRQLLLADLVLCFQKLSFVFGILLPFQVRNADPFGELYPTWPNIKAVILHVVLVILQAAFFVSLPLFSALPTSWLLGYIVAFTLVNSALTRLLNGSSLTLEPSNDIVPKIKHDSEYWIYMNGVSVGRDWLQSNIDRLSLTFGRRVHGVHNPTDGIILDLIQCLIQRNLYFATTDVRQAYVSIKAALYNKKINKVVCILHSQGGLEGGMILDWLLAEVPRDHIKKLEVYTFGNAANHFNNPSMIDTTTPDGVTARAATRAIGHIEHYANVGDFVSQIGVLNYATNPGLQNRFMGRLFVSPHRGHLMNQHYLHNMFPLGPDKQCLDTNPFMETDVVVESVGGDVSLREGPGELVSQDNGDDVTFVGDINSPILPQSPSSSFSSDMLRSGMPRTLKVKHLSRLWLYRNGRVPPDDFIRRSATA